MRQQTGQHGEFLCYSSIACVHEIKGLSLPPSSPPPKKSYPNYKGKEQEQLEVENRGGKKSFRGEGGRIQLSAGLIFRKLHQQWAGGVGCWVRAGAQKDFPNSFSSLANA